ncbi:MAG: YHS domain-containing protein [Deltaproteobacteria bacterium]|nr:YHS domain-containing protein [Deltaproteobacteria bacterium]
MNYLRWLIIVVLFYLIYRVIKGLFLPRSPFEDQPASSWPSDEAENNKDASDLVQDPQCGVYLPQAEAIRYNVNGKTLYFCSQKCKREFIETQK